MQVKKTCKIIRPSPCGQTFLTRSKNQHPNIMNPRVCSALTSLRLNWKERYPAARRGGRGGRHSCLTAVSSAYACDAPARKDSLRRLESYTCMQPGVTKRLREQHKACRSRKLRPTSVMLCKMQRVLHRQNYRELFQKRSNSKFQYPPPPQTTPQRCLLSLQRSCHCRAPDRYTPGWGSRR